MSSKPTTVRRRSSRLAAKPSVSYAETAEVPDEILMDRTKAMFETLLAERLAPATRDLTGVYWRCRKEFLKLFADLPADDVERIAAETFEGKLPLTACGHAITHSYMVADTTRRYRAHCAEINAKVAMEKPVIVTLIEEYNNLMKSARAIERCSKILKTAIMEERTPSKSSRLRHGISDAAHRQLRKTHSDAHSNKHILEINKLIRTGSVTKVSLRVL